MRLNQYIGHTGYCTRREATRYILRGEIQVNGVVEKNDGYTVMEDDIVTHNGKTLEKAQQYSYLLMNKPRHFTTTKSEENPKYILGLLKNRETKNLVTVDEKGAESIGLVIITDDQKVAEKLRDPSRNIKRIYHITLDKECTESELESLAKSDKLEIKSAKHIIDKEHNHIGLELLKGNEQLLSEALKNIGKEITRIDCSYYAGLNKKDLKRGWHRPLTIMEERMLKHFI